VFAALAPQLAAVLMQLTMPPLALHAACTYDCASLAWCRYWHCASHWLLSKLTLTAQPYHVLAYLCIALHCVVLQGEAAATPGMTMQLEHLPTSAAYHYLSPALHANSLTAVAYCCFAGEVGCLVHRS
jgi:hypothetical protein